MKNPIDPSKRVNSRQSMQSLLSDPVVIFVIELLFSAAVTVIVSILVARRWGEMAATKYTLNTTERSNHHRSLVGEPLTKLRQSLSSLEINQIMNVSVMWQPELVARRIDFNASNSPEVSLLLSHLEKGYTELYSRMLKYQEAYDRLSASIVQVYNRAIEILKGKWGRAPLEKSWRIDGGYGRIMEAFSTEVANRLVRGNQPQVVGLSPDGSVRLGSYAIIQGVSLSDVLKVSQDVNSLFDDPDVFDKLQEIWKTVQPLLRDCEYFNRELDTLRAYVQTGGIHLRGSCPAGREAGYE